MEYIKSTTIQNINFSCNFRVMIALITLTRVNQTWRIQPNISFEYVHSAYRHFWFDNKCHNVKLNIDTSSGYFKLLQYSIWWLCMLYKQQSSEMQTIVDSYTFLLLCKFYFQLTLNNKRQSNTKSPHETIGWRCSMRWDNCKSCMKSEMIQQISYFK